MVETKYGTFILPFLIPLTILTSLQMENHVVPAEVQRLARHSVIGPLDSQLKFTRNSFKSFVPKSH